MHDQIQSQDEYDTIVSELASEFTVEISAGNVHNVAGHLVAEFSIVDGTPIVTTACEYAGGSVESIDARLNPYLVLEYTRTDNVYPRSDTSSYPTPSASDVAIIALQSDLLAAHNDRYNQGDTEQETGDLPDMEV